MHLLPADQLPTVHATLLDAGYAVASVVTPVRAGLRETQAELARALRLPGTAATNLDAMADALRDLAQIWGTPRVALVWEDAERLAGADGRAWWILGELLDDAEDLTVVALGEARLGRPPATDDGRTTGDGRTDADGPTDEAGR